MCGSCCGIRHRMVQMRTRIMNQSQSVALNEGVRLRRGYGESEQATEKKPINDNLAGLRNDLVGFGDIGSDTMREIGIEL